MYIRAVHAEADLRVLRRLIHDNPLGMLTTGIRSEKFPFLQTSHIPFVLDVEDESSETELGCLRGHLARQNPQSKAMIEYLESKPELNAVLEEEVLVLFNQAAHHYVTPKFYTETKPTSGKVVPTWNYAAAQAYGKARVFFKASSEETSAFLTSQMADLTHHNETTTMGYTEENRPTPWKVTDAPDKYIELLKKAIIGIEIKITRLEGKFKMSQEMSKGDRDGVAEGFARLESDAAKEVSQMVKVRSDEKSRS
ncbi:transcriptional regulator PAI 2-type [Ilyonectria destructans]|nr:transcriptional regulator PAI 2-type [Ilyonectria destructans]